MRKQQEPCHPPSGGIRAARRSADPRPSGRRPDLAYGSVGAGSCRLRNQSSIQLQPPRRSAVLAAQESQGQGHKDQIGRAHRSRGPQCGHSAQGLPPRPSSVRSPPSWPFVQRQDSGLWIRQWWFESTRANNNLARRSLQGVVTSVGTSSTEPRSGEKTPSRLEGVFFASRWGQTRWGEARSAPSCTRHANTCALLHTPSVGCSSLPWPTP
jgi:hypothetical protein